MSLENKGIIPVEYTDKIDKAIYTAGYLGFGIDYLVNCIELDLESITKQFVEKKGKDYRIWVRGFYKAQTELRTVIIGSALSSSTPNIEKMLSYFADLHDELQTLELEEDE